ncbi:hypothetical protein PR002_g26194 [Phytophthora rubi]|uniref:Uncharacterized protein n=1 Tax=Phytophthora rubi TaxID=129364 RepID=A0A6A3HS11_9STRA|nr:hypothetical protein PR002_g26194 [Phytophthora rubi]
MWRSAWTWTVCETACGIFLGSLTTRLAAYGPDVHKARRTTRWRVRAWSGTLTRLAPCTTVWVAWRPKRNTA